MLVPRPRRSRVPQLPLALTLQPLRGKRKQHRPHPAIQRQALAPTRSGGAALACQMECPPDLPNPAAKFGSQTFQEIKMRVSGFQRHAVIASTHGGAVRSPWRRPPIRLGHRGVHRQPRNHRIESVPIRTVYSDRIVRSIPCTTGSVFEINAALSGLRHLI